MIENRNSVYIYFILLTAFLIITSVIWLKIDTRPPAWDESIHLNLTLDYLELIRSHPPNLLIQLLDISSYYPPLYHLLVVPFHIIFGISEDNFIFVNIIFMVILLFSVWQIGKKVYSDNFGLISASILSAYPIIQWSFHRPLLDLPITAMVMFTIYIYLITEEFSNRKYSVLLGIVIGLSMLIKWSYVFFISVPMTIYFIKLLKDKFSGISKEQKLLNFCSVIIIATVIMAPWYLRHCIQLLIKFNANMKGAILSEKDPNIFSISSFIYYIRFLLPQLNIWFLGLFIVGTVIFFYKWNKSNIELLIWLFSGYISITLVANKDIRFSMPLLPLVSLISTYFLIFIRNINHKKSVIKVLVFTTLLIFFINNFFFYLFFKTPTNLFWDDIPKKENWLQNIFIEKIISNYDKNTDIVNVRFVTNTAYFSSNNFKYFYRVKKRNVPKLYFIDFERKITELSDFIIYKTNYKGQEFMVLQFLEAIKAITSKKNYFVRNFNKVYETHLPDNSVAILYKLQPQEWNASHITVNYLTELLKRHLDNYGIITENITINLVQISDTETRKGHFKSVIIKAPYIRYQGLPVRNFYLELNDIIINIPALIEDSQLIILKLREIVPKFNISVSDLKELIKTKLTELDLKSLEINNNELRIDGYLKKINISAVIRIELLLQDKKLKICLEKLNILKYLRIPKYIYENFIDQEISLEPSCGLPATIKLNNILLDKGSFELK